MKNLILCSASIFLITTIEANATVTTLEPLPVLPIVRGKDLSDEYYTEIIKAKSKFSFVEQFRKRSSFLDVNSFDLSTSLDSIQKYIDQSESIPLHESDLEVLLGLYLKKQTLLPEKKIEDKKRLLSIFLSSPKLKEDYFETWSHLNSENYEKIDFYSVSQIQYMFNLISKKDEIILVDGHEISQLEIMKISKLPHQWVFVSNSKKPVVFFGYLDGFSLLLKKVSYFDSQCLSKVSPFEGLENYKVQFLLNEKSCLSLFEKESSPIESEKPRQQITENQNAWVLPVTVVLGILAANSLKDKKISLKTPSWKF